MAEYGKKTKKLGKRIAKANQPKVAAKLKQPIKKAGSLSMISPTTSPSRLIPKKSGPFSALAKKAAAKKSTKRGMR